MGTELISKLDRQAPHRAAILRCALLCFCVTLAASGLKGAEPLPPGHRPVPLGVHALVGAKVVVRPGTVLEPATVVIRDGSIEAVGVDVPPPADARIWDRKGFTIYAGFIDLCFAPASRGAQEAGSSASEPELAAGVTEFFGISEQAHDPRFPGPKHELSQIVPERRVADRYDPEGKALEAMRELGFTAGNVIPDRGILRGTGALVVFSDATANEALVKPDVFHHAVLDTDGGGRGAYPGSLMGVIAAFRQSFLDAEHYALDQADYARQLGKRPRPAFNPALAALKPLLDRQFSILIEPRSALMVDRAARLAQEFGLDFMIVSSGQEWRRPDLARAAGVPFIVPLNFPEAPKMPEEDDWLSVSLDQLRAWDWAAENAAVLRKENVTIALTTFGLSDRKAFRKNLRTAIDRGLSENDALAALTTVPATLSGMEKLWGTVEAGKAAHLTVVSGTNYFDQRSKVHEVWIDGRVFPGQPDTPSSEPKKKTEDETKPIAGQEKDGGAKGTPGEKETDRVGAAEPRVARSPQEGRGPLAEPRGVLIRDATIWTCGPAGRIERGSLLIIDGKVSKAGLAPIANEAGLPAGELLVINGEGKHVTPGLIDAHSHAMILGGVNEGTLPSTAMVRISDVVNSETVNIYHQLAGGLTIANLLHGSANPIGGQNSIIKLRDGAPPEELKLASAPAGIKFALGENVKQSNRQSATRFPQSRMGVRSFFANRFVAAQQYLRDWERHRTYGGLRPRRDLELEALGEIIEGERWIHCHSYRQDEILMFLRIMESFKVKVGTLQHILEGYKVADEIARHGAGASCFSDWWAYKFEVYDAIPYAGSLMRDRGVLVSFNSDDRELARRMNLEAAKAVKYGGTGEVEALNFVTINPAKQLGIDQHVGSLEPGKDADFVIWTGSPLDTKTICLETWIDGKKYFDRAEASERAAARLQEWKELVAKAKKLSGSAPRDGSAAARAAFFHVALEHRHDRVNRHCDDE